MKYTAKVMGRGTGVSVIEVDASSVAEVIAQVKGRRLEVISVKAASSLPKLPSLFSTHFSLTLFSEELLALLEAGMTQVEAIETITEEAQGSTLLLLEAIVGLLYEGKSLSMALERFPAVFPKLYVELIRSSEKTGNVGDSLKQYIKYQYQIGEIRKKIINASVYPVVLVIAGSLVTMFLLFYVVPKFSTIYHDIGRDLPFLSRLLMNWGEYLNEHAGTVAAGLAAVLGALIFSLSRQSVRAWIGARIRQIPTVGNQYKIYQLALLYRTVGMLLAGGVHVVSAMEMVSGLLQPDTREKLLKARANIREGVPVSDSMNKFDLTTPIGLKLLRVGERTGRLDDMCEHIAHFYDEDTARWVDWFTRLFEPILMAVIGTVIGLIVVMMYFPIFELAGSLQ